MPQNLSFSPQNVMYFIISFLVQKYSHITWRLCSNLNDQLWDQRVEALNRKHSRNYPGMLAWRDWGNPWKSPFKTVISQSKFKPDISQMRVRILSISGNLFINAALNGKIPTNTYQTLPQFCKHILWRCTWKLPHSLLELRMWSRAAFCH